jgi:hypothetical protein
MNHGEFLASVLGYKPSKKISFTIGSQKVGLLDFAKPREKAPSHSKFKVSNTKNALVASPLRSPGQGNTLRDGTLLKQQALDDNLISYRPNKKRGAPFSFKFVPDVEEIEDASYFTQRKKQTEDKASKQHSKKRRKIQHDTDSSSISTPSSDTPSNTATEPPERIVVCDTPLPPCTEGSSTSGGGEEDSGADSAVLPKKDVTSVNYSLDETQKLLSQILKEVDSSISESMTQGIDDDKLDHLSETDKNRLIKALFEENVYFRRRINDLTDHLQNTYPNKFRVNS